MATASEIITRARENRAKQVQKVTWPGWDVELTIAPASASQLYQAQEIAANIEAKQGRARPLQLETNVAWVAACVLEPKFTAVECYELADADPGQFEKLAQLCQAISQGTPLSILCLHVWASLADANEAREAKGEIPAGSSRFWRSVVNGFIQFIDGNGAEPQAIAQAILDAAPQTFGDAATAMDAFFEQLEVDRKNAFEGSSASGQPASSTPDEPPASLSETGGTGQTSTT